MLIDIWQRFEWRS